MYVKMYVEMYVEMFILKRAVGWCRAIEPDGGDVYQPKRGPQQQPET